jgi:hypothetical protein
MRQDLQIILFEKYPKIFSEKDLDMTKTAMCWGICVGDGWYTLIDRLCDYLQFLTDKQNAPQVVASQVKEKFGTLRFHTRGVNEEQDAIISFAESLSGSICETCGKPANMDNRRTETGWIVTRCDECFEN